MGVIIHAQRDLPGKTRRGNAMFHGRGAPCTGFKVVNLVYWWCLLR